MREIKFRAWWQHDKYNPEGSMFGVAAVDWSAPDEGEPERELHDNPTEVGLVDYPYKTGTYQKIGWNKDCKLMQYTGLKDKNGVEIYEGDILHEYEEVTHSFSESKDYIADNLHTVKYVIDHLGAHFLACSRPTRYYIDKDEDYTIWIDTNTMEVIGNIYENPELLESKDEV